MKRKITLKDIAQELEVSISTVSKALKNSQEIGRDTKDKVQAFAKLYNYRPNNIALSLKNKRTKNIGVIIPDIIHHFFTTVFRGIEKYANQKEYNVIVCVSDESFDKEVINTELLANGSIDGFVMSLSAGTQRKGDFHHLLEITQQGIPLVLFDRVDDKVPCDKVVLNDKEIAYQAVKKFIADGRKNIALVTTDSYFNVSKKRAEGYKDALAETGMPVRPELVLTLPFEDLTEKLMKRFFGAHKIDAVLCVNEIFAVQGMAVVQKMGMKIPDDIAFIGFTDGMLSKYVQPTLTTVAQHGEQMGEIAAQMLIERIEMDIDVENPYRTAVVEATIIDRESTVNQNR